MFKNNNNHFKQLKYYKIIIERNNVFHVQFLFVPTIYIYISSGTTKMCAGYTTFLNVQGKENYSTHNGQRLLFVFNETVLLWRQYV